MTLKERIKSLLTAANATTGKSDTDLTAGVQSLIDGFGGGGDESPIGDYLAKGHDFSGPIISNTRQIGAFACKQWNLTSGAFLPQCEKFFTESFEYCKLAKIDLPKAARFDNYVFYGCKNLVTVILRNDNVAVCYADAKSNIFADTPISRGEGYVYVPKALVEQYKVASNWATIASQFRAIEDYPEITGGAK